MEKIKLTHQRLCEILEYNPENGKFLYKLPRLRQKREVGTEAGTLRSDGYIRIKIDKKGYFAHRLAWFYVNKEMPKTLDHINRIKNDNRIENLREVSCSENQQNVSLRKNNTSGFHGVYWNKRKNRWFGQIRLNKKKIFLGYFLNLEDAVAAANSARKKYHPFFG